MLLLHLLYVYRWNSRLWHVEISLKCFVSILYYSLPFSPIFSPSLQTSKVLSPSLQTPKVHQSPSSTPFLLPILPSLKPFDIPKNLSLIAGKSVIQTIVFIISIIIHLLQQKSHGRWNRPSVPRHRRWPRHNFEEEKSGKDFDSYLLHPPFDWY